MSGQLATMGALAIVAGTILFGSLVFLSVATSHTFTETITITDKRPLGDDQILIFNGTRTFRAPGYLWSDIGVGKTYTISASTTFIDTNEGWVTQIEEVTP